MTNRIVRLEGFSAWRGYPVVEGRATASGAVVGGSDVRGYASTRMRRRALMIQSEPWTRAESGCMLVFLLFTQIWAIRVTTKPCIEEVSALPEMLSWPAPMGTIHERRVGDRLG